MFKIERKYFEAAVQDQFCLSEDGRILYDVSTHERLLGMSDDELYNFLCPLDEVGGFLTDLFKSVLEKQLTESKLEFSLFSLQKVENGYLFVQIGQEDSVTTVAAKELSLQLFTFTKKVMDSSFGSYLSLKGTGNFLGKPVHEEEFNDDLYFYTIYKEFQADGDESLFAWNPVQFEVLDMKYYKVLDQHSVLEYAYEVKLHALVNGNACTIKGKVILDAYNGFYAILSDFDLPLSADTKIMISSIVGRYAEQMIPNFYAKVF